MTVSTRWWFAAFILAVFLAGTAVGVIVDRAWLLRAGPAAANADGQRATLTEERLVEANLMRLRSLLELDASQYESVQAAVREWAARVLAITSGVRGRGQLLSEVDRAQLRAETDRLEQALSPLLLPAQRQYLTSVRRVLVVPAPRPGGRIDGRGGRQGPGRAGPGRPAGTGRE